MPRLTLKHYLILAGIGIVMTYLVAAERPIVAKAVTRIVNGLF
jgi:hypothetical protein